MNRTSNIVIGFLAVVALIVGVIAYNKTPVSVLGAQGQQGVKGEQGAPGRDGQDGVNGRDGVTKVITQVVEKPVTLGAMSGPEVGSRTHFARGLTEGGYIATTSAVTLSTYTTGSNDFREAPAVILWTNNVNTTVTLNATSTFYYVPNIGDVATVMFLNATTTAAGTITFAAQNASVDLQFAEATGGDLVLNGLDWAKLTFIRQSENKVTVIFDEMTEAD